MADPPTTLRTVAEHQDQILDSLRPLAPYDQPLLDALGLVAAEDVFAPIALPSFDNSAMDGYAVVQDDVATATDESPVHLPVVGEIGAGQARILALSPGTAVKIMTGAPVPAGADAVVPYEWTDRGVAQVVISRAPERGQHVRSAGEDVAEGDLLIEEGTLLGPRQLGLLASVGRASVVVRPRPRVVILSTGSELRDPGTVRGHDSIYDGNSYMLAAAVRRAGAIAYRVGIVPDEPQAFLDALGDQLVRADAVITTGGVSMGDYDVVKEALAPSGTVWFGGVAMQPGKPQGFGVVGEDEIPIFTLPGNPVSSFISFEMFVLPALRRMMGRLPYARPDRRGDAHPRRDLATRPRAVPARRARLRRRARHRLAGRRAGLAPGRRPGPGQRADRGADRHHLARRRCDRHRRAPGPGVLMAESPAEPRLTHVDESGAARMVDVSGKAVTARSATASGRVLVSPQVIDLLRGDGVPKGDTLGVARLAGIMGAKQTPLLIPLCHPLMLSSVTVDLAVGDESVDIVARVSTTERTGVEMEALTAVSVAALTVIDMVKAVDKGAVITDVRVETKTGGKSGDWSR